MTTVTNKATAAVTLTLRESYPVKTVGDDTLFVNFAALPPEVLTEIVQNGAIRILTDCCAGKKTDAEKLAAMQKRVDAWERGSFTIVDRAPALATLMRDAWLAEQSAQHAGDQKQIEKALNDAAAQLVKDTFGKDAKNTFANYLEAVAKQMAKAGEGTEADLLAELESHYEQKALELQAERDKAAKDIKIDVSAIDLTAFRKQK